MTDPSKLSLDEILKRAEAAALGASPPEGDDEVEVALPAARPDLSKLRDALDEFGLPVFSPGDKIVVERRNILQPGHPYLDTQTYLVRKINMANGDLVLWNEGLTQWAMDNFVKGAAIGQVYKLAGRHDVAPKRKRGRPRKHPLSEADTAPKEKKKRGRPPGSKNRPKEVIRAEKAAKRAAKKGKGK
jgi:hypothetical protein